MKTLLLIVILWCPLAGSLKGQNITGRVIDSKTSESLAFVDVFINNTTLGTVTDANGEFNLTAPKAAGTYDLVLSFVGYESHKAKVVVDEGKVAMGIIKLIPSEIQLGAVEVSSRRDKVWERKLKKFEKIFLGVDKLAAGCTIVNAWVIDFPPDHHGNRFVAKASAPIEIENKSLGYKVIFYLSDFWDDGVGYSIAGNVRFTKLIGTDAREIAKWEANRKNSYHHFKSTVGHRVSEKGQTVVRYDTTAMSTVRVGGILPLDYDPESIINVGKYQPGQLKTPVQELTKLDSLMKKTERYSQKHPEEKVYVHFDKPFYVLGETCWYKAYVVAGSNLNPTDISSVLNLDWVDPSGEVIKHQRLKIENGSATGDFTIKTTLSAGTYTVRAYTNWMRNQDPELFYSKGIPVFEPGKTQPASVNGPDQSKVDLQFFPEGGTMLSDVKTLIAFKAIGGNGMGVEVKGRIVDEQNDEITTFTSTHNGMGIFPFIAHDHKLYRAILPNGDVYPLPSPSGTLTLSASNINAGKIVVRIQSGKEYKSSATYLLGYSRGSICYAAFIKMDKAEKDIAISKDEIPEGVLRLTLFDDELIPQCERMLFIKKEGGLAINIQGNEEQYAPRDSIVLNFKLIDHAGNTAQTSLSVSVTDGGVIAPDKSSENIYTRLLLQSDIKGNVENPGWYFGPRTTEKTFGLDLVMLTHGWSRYNWRSILNPGPDSIFYRPESGITLEGRILKNNKPVANVPFVLTAPQSKNDFSNIYESDSLGHFTVFDLDFFDSTMFSWRVMNGKGRVQNAEIRFDTVLRIPPVIQSGKSYQASGGSKDELFRRMNARYIKAGVWNMDNTITLNEVVVKAHRMEIKAVNAHTIAVKPNAQDLRSRISTSTFVGRFAMGLPFAILKEMPGGAQVWGFPSVRGFAPVVITIDGMRAETTGIAGNPNEILSSIPIEQIEQIYVSDSGEIVVWTKNTGAEGLETIRKRVKGYDLRREFYHPRYGASDISATSPDNRVTLYWNANLQTNEEGVATAKFYNNDTTRKLLIVVEGIADGQAVSGLEILGKD